MSQYEKLLLLLSIMSGTKDKSILFADLRTVLDRLGYQCRIKGDHFIYTKDGAYIAEVPEPKGRLRYA